MRKVSGTLTSVVRSAWYVVLAFGTDTSSYDVDTGIRGRGSDRVNERALRPVGQPEEYVCGFVNRSDSGDVCKGEIDATGVARIADQLRGFSPLPPKSSGEGCCSLAAVGADSRESVDVLDSGSSSRRQRTSSPSYQSSFQAVDVVPESVQPSTFLPTIEAVRPWVVPIRGHLDDIARLMAGDLYIGRGSRQRGLLPSTFSNPYKVGEYGRTNAIQLFEQHLDTTPDLVRQVPSLSGKRLICHCSKGQQCHADILIRKFVELFPSAYDRSATEQRPPTSSELNLLAAHRQEQLSDDGSSADEDVPERGSGWTGIGSPLQAGNGYTSRDYCDGQGLPSPGRWPVQNRRYPSTERWKKVMTKFSVFVKARCKPDLLIALAMGRVETCPFDPSEISRLKGSIVANLASDGLELERRPGDREDVPIDFRFLGLLLAAADVPEVGLGNFAQGVRVGPGTRMPRLPALYRPKRKWRLASQTDPRAYQDEEGQEGESCWRRNYATLLPLAKEVMDVLVDQTERGQVIRLSEEEAKLGFPRLVVASLGANRKDRPNGEVGARVLHDGTNGLSVNTRTRLRDQERSPISSDIKRAMREKSSRGLTTFALTADVKEAHRQIPIDPRDWHLLGCQVERGADVFVNTVGTFGITSASYY